MSQSKCMDTSILKVKRSWFDGIWTRERQWTLKLSSSRYHREEVAVNFKDIYCLDEARVNLLTEVKDIWSVVSKYRHKMVAKSGFSTENDIKMMLTFFFKRKIHLTFTHVFYRCLIGWVLKKTHTPKSIKVLESCNIVIVIVIAKAFALVRYIKNIVQHFGTQTFLLLSYNIYNFYSLALNWSWNSKYLMFY